jgi:glutamine amidotransferase
VENALRALGASWTVTSRPGDLDGAASAIFPGVGEAAASMAELSRTGLDAALRRFVASGRKVLGICIGCQVIFDRSDERDTPCLGLVPGSVRRFPAAAGLKVPHMGWNTVRVTRPHPVLDGLPPEDTYYFVHSYYPSPSDPSVVAAVTEYGVAFPSIVARANLVAFQFHVEKSGPAGLRLLDRWLAWNGRGAGA